MAQAMVTATDSQFASATVHLELRAEWRAVRISGVRYIVLTSGTSGRIYHVRADADGCLCRWYVNTGRQCSHMLALELAATEDELAEAPRLADLYPYCARVGCSARTEGTTLCDECSAIKERSERLAAARARIVGSYL